MTVLCQQDASGMLMRLDSSWTSHISGDPCPDVVGCAATASGCGSWIQRDLRVPREHFDYANVIASMTIHSHLQ